MLGRCFLPTVSPPRRPLRAAWGRVQAYTRHAQALAHAFSSWEAWVATQGVYQGTRQAATRHSHVLSKNGVHGAGREGCLGKGIFSSGLPRRLPLRQRRCRFSAAPVLVVRPVNAVFGFRHAIFAAAPPAK